MSEFRLYDRVCVRQLLHPLGHYDGWHVNQRPPQVGEAGTIVEILQAPGMPDRFVVECSGADGVCIWLGDFSAQELELHNEPFA